MNQNIKNTIGESGDKVVRSHKLGWFSSPDRGLQHSLKMWPKIIEKFPDAELHVFYGFELFKKAYQNNPERMKWMAKMLELMETLPNIKYHGRIGQGELDDWMKKLGVMMYPTDFDETNCIVALSAQSNGCVPCTMDKAGLKDTVGSGIKVTGEIWDAEVREEYLTKLLDLMGNEDKWQEESKKGIEFAKSYSWDKIAQQWVKHF